MPARKKNCESVITMKKQKQLVDNRLLEISILVEDYIYEDKPIKRYEAEMYAKEVASYVDKCLGDERSLQVSKDILKLFDDLCGEFDFCHLKGKRHHIISETMRSIKNILRKKNTYSKFLKTHFSLKISSETKPMCRPCSVIEKLRRHMRGIIAEQGESVDKDIFGQPIPGTTPMLDDHFTQDIEVTDATQESNNPNCGKEPVKTGRNKRKASVKRNIQVNSRQDDNLTQCIQNIEVIDSTQEKISPNCVEEPVKNDRNKRKATVKRNIRISSELDDDLTQCTQNIEFEDPDTELSSLNSIQTPINKVSNKNAIKRNKRNIQPLDDDMTQYRQANTDIQDLNTQNSVGKPNTRSRNKSNSIVKSNIRKTKVRTNVSENYRSEICVIDLCDENDNKTEYNNVINIDDSPQDSILSLYIPNTPAFLSVCSPSILNNFDTVPKILKSKKQEAFEKPNPSRNVIDIVKNVVEYTKELNDNNELIKEFTDRNILEVRNTTFPIKDNHIEKIEINQINIKNTSNISAVNPLEISKNKVNKALNTYSKVKTLKKGSIYNEKVINDLSWIENIRYVREIAKEECEKVSIPDNFWDNYMLPEKWNDDDFLYT